MDDDDDDDFGNMHKLTLLDAVIGQCAVSYGNTLCQHDEHDKRDLRHVNFEL